MANWKHKLQFGDLNERYDKGMIDISEFGKAVAKRIRQQIWYKDYPELKFITERFVKVKSETSFDRALEMLYDWGDGEWAPSHGVMANRNCFIDLTGWTR